MRKDIHEYIHMHMYLRAFALHGSRRHTPVPSFSTSVYVLPLRAPAASVSLSLYDCMYVYIRAVLQGGCGGGLERLLRA